MGHSATPLDSRMRLGELISQTMGLHFPPERYADLERGLAGAAEEFGLPDAGACVDWLLGAPLSKSRLQVLARHLTVGETYFFRERKAFDVLARSVLPELIRVRRAGGRRLRVWSAACCTGEEPYSVAILLHQLLPDLADWHVTILATDINERFLNIAVAGVYGEWSFRESPAWLKARYFQRTAAGGYAILPEIGKLVTFAHLNLAQDAYPALATGTNSMDLILCRNVLMYFSPGQAQEVVRKLRHAMVDDGWLAVGATDGSQSLFSEFEPVNFPGVVLYQKRGADQQITPQQPQAWRYETVAPVAEVPFSWRLPALEPLMTEDVVIGKEAPDPYATASAFYQHSQYAEASEILLASLDLDRPHAAETLSLLTRALANQGKLTEALAWCNRWVAADKLNPSGHYLRAVVFQELGDDGQARRSLLRAVYLDPDFVLAHFALGNLARNDSQNDRASRHFSLALRLLDKCQPADPLLESDGLTAGQLIEIIKSISALKTAP